MADPSGAPPGEAGTAGTPAAVGAGTVVVVAIGGVCPTSWRTAAGRRVEAMREDGLTSASSRVAQDDGTLLVLRHQQPEQ
ncbi:hypothetical protein [Actinomyces sp. HMT897]|uniref:hypothetical protein n=1 Tax=Actinomyces sp. HMT897 TaxID=2789424 RepID=UPI001AEDE0DA|nr:hypothetical protein [Actinomyces sp. HMT897]